MTYLRLRFADEDAARETLAAYLDADGAWLAPDRLLVLGTLHARATVDGETVTPGAPLPGWHVDLVTDDPVELAILAVHAVTPLDPLHIISGQHD